MRAGWHLSPWLLVLAEVVGVEGGQVLADSYNQLNTALGCNTTNFDTLNFDPSESRPAPAGYLANTR